MGTGYPRAVSPSRVPGKTVLRVGGTPAATVESYVGGEAYADVINEPGGLLPYAKKHLSELKYADLEAQVGMDAHPALFRWIRDAWFGSPEKDLVALDRFGAGTAPSVELTRATIMEVTLPALDYNARDRRFLSMKIACRSLRHTNTLAKQSERQERDFFAHNFGITIDGIDCGGVLAVDACTVKTTLPEPGSKRKPTLVFPDIHLHVDEEKADPFREWFEDFVINGNNDDDKEREGSISYQDPMLSGALCTLQLVHLGIYRIAAEPQQQGGPRRVRVDLYCERMELAASEAASAGDTQPLKPVRV